MVICQWNYQPKECMSTVINEELLRIVPPEVIFRWESQCLSTNGFDGLRKQARIARYNHRVKSNISYVISLFILLTAIGITSASVKICFFSAELWLVKSMVLVFVILFDASMVWLMIRSFKDRELSRVDANLSILAYETQLHRFSTDLQQLLLPEEPLNGDTTRTQALRDRLKKLQEEVGKAGTDIQYKKAVLNRILETAISRFGFDAASLFETSTRGELYSGELSLKEFSLKA